MIAWFRRLLAYWEGEPAEYVSQACLERLQHEREVGFHAWQAIVGEEPERASQGWGRR